MQKFRSQFTDYKGDPGITNNKPSQTTPDMSLSIKQLLLNHTRGIDSGIEYKEGAYYGDLEIPVITDPTEIADKRAELERQKAEITEQAKKEIEEKQKLETIPKHIKDEQGIETPKKGETPAKQPETPSKEE